MPNRLADSSSPYLRQHQDNPVDWWPWCEEALEEARRQDKPIFLSIGYSACHWCHVMAHESFDDQEVADALNRDFISIKLDREERPDIDEIYMTACQIATGHGGWPLTVFMTPDEKPFFVGTYFPRYSRGEFPGFQTVVTSLASAWRDSKDELIKSAEEFGRALSDTLAKSSSVLPTQPSYDLLDRSIETFHATFDYENGGFGGAPKFPPHAGLRFFLNYASRRHNAGEVDEVVEEYMAQSAHMALLTLEKMALAGIHDHVGGGFHRYATDHLWHLPHFEKMLTDNAQLLHAYHLASSLSEDPRLKSTFDRAASGIVTWLRREMTDESGLFFTALDADSEGEEGLFYTWEWDEIERALGEDADVFRQAFQCLPEGNFLDEATQNVMSRNVLDLADHADFSSQLEKLRIARESRPQPGLDDKCIASANGLLIGALASAGQIEMAARCARVWVDAMADELPHQITGGRASGPAFLDDYAFLADGLLDLFASTENHEWRIAAQKLADRMVERFADQSAPGFWFSEAFESSPLGRTKPALDYATPGPGAVALRVLWRLGMRQEFDRHFPALLGWAQRMPQAAETLLDILLTYIIDAGDEQIESAGPELDAVRVSLSPREIKADADGWGHAMVTLHIPTGQHVNTHEPPAAWLIPTSLKVDGVLGEAGFPEGENDRFEGEVSIPIRLRAKKSTEEFQLTVRFQACTESACKAPEERVLTGVLIVS